MTGECAICGHTVAYQGAGGNWVTPEGRLGVLQVTHWFCPNCLSPYVAVEEMGQSRKTLMEWPNAGSKPAPPAVPPAVADDWREAHVDLGVRTWKSAATMARRAVQGVCVDKAASAGKLVSQINELGKNNTLHPSIVEWAHQIRLFGNEGAHPGDDGLADVTEEDARAAVAFLDELLDWVYVMPHKLLQSKARSGNP